MSQEQIVHVIDDDEAVRDSLSFLLRAAGFEAKTYESATLFLEAVKAGVGGMRDHRCAHARHERARSAAALAADGGPPAGDRGHRSWRCAACGRGDESGRRRFSGKAVRRRAHAGNGADRARRQARDAARTPEQNAIAERLASLSQRERQVLDGLVAGQPNKTIAYELGISPRTVEVYRAHVMTKMQANSLSELVRMALIAELP